MENRNKSVSLAELDDRRKERSYRRKLSDSISFTKTSKFMTSISKHCTLHSFSLATPTTVPHTADVSPSAAGELVSHGKSREQWETIMFRRCHEWKSRQDAIHCTFSLLGVDEKSNDVLVLSRDDLDLGDIEDATRYRSICWNLDELEKLS